MWVLPAVGFAVAARLSSDTSRAQVVLLGAWSGVLLVPAGLLALLITHTLAPTIRTPYAFKLALAASLVALAIAGLFLAVANFLT